MSFEPNSHASHACESTEPTIGIPRATACSVSRRNSAFGEPFTYSAPVSSQKSRCTSTSTNTLAGDGCRVMLPLAMSSLLSRGGARRRLARGLPCAGDDAGAHRLDERAEL
ncbi:hypothetical protein BE11_22885, partial [Sorangium cellulosum]